MSSINIAPRSIMRGRLAAIMSFMAVMILCLCMMSYCADKPRGARSDEQFRPAQVQQEQQKGGGAAAFVILLLVSSVALIAAVRNGKMAREDVSELNQELNQAKQDVANIRESLDRVIANLGAIEACSKTDQSDVTQLETRLTQCEDKLAALESMVMAISDTENRIEAQISRFGTRLDELTGLSETNAERIKTLQDELKKPVPAEVSPVQAAPVKVQPEVVLNPAAKQPQKVKASSTAVHSYSDVDIWRQMQEQLESASRHYGSKALQADVDESRKYLEVLVEMTINRKSPAEDAAAWSDHLWLNKLDEALYGKPVFYCVEESECDQQEIRRVLNTLQTSIIPNVQQQCIKHMHKQWQISRIEGIEGETQQQPHVLERDTWNDPEPTQDLNKDGRFYRIVPGRGGYMWGDEVLRPTFAIFYTYTGQSQL